MLNVAAMVVTPFRFDDVIIHMFQGLSARVVVDVDLCKRLPDRVLVL